MRVAIGAVVLYGLTLGASPGYTVDFKKTGVRFTGTVSVTSSSAGTQVCDFIDDSCFVQVPSAAAVPVCFAPVNDGTACSAGLTSAVGKCITAGNAWDFLPREDGWTGQVCAILQSGSTAVSVSVIRR